MPAFDLLAVLAWFTNPDSTSTFTAFAITLAQLVSLGLAVLYINRLLKRRRRRRPSVERLADPTYHPDLDGPDRHTRSPQ
jgi:hypothetical protein